MYALLGTQSLQGSADVASKINYTVIGDELVSGTTDTFEVIVQGQLAATVGSLHSPGSGNSCIITKAHLFNTDTVQRVANLYLNGTGASSQIATFTIPAGGWASYERGADWKVYNAAGLPITSGVSSVSATDGTLVATPTIGAVTISRAAITGDATIPAGSNAATVAALQGKAVASGAPGTNQALIWSGTAWTATTITESMVTGLTTDLAAKATDTLVVHLAGTEAVSGTKNFTAATVSATPAASTDITNKLYVDSVANGLNARHAAVTVFTAPVTLSGLPGANDGVSATAGQLVLVTAQANPVNDGLWLVSAGAWTRPIFFATAADAVGTYVMVATGTVFAGSEWFIVGASPITVDTTSQTWVEVTGLFDITVDVTLTKSGNQISRAALAGGDVTAPTGSNVLTLANSGPGAVGPFGSSSTTAVVSTDAKGRVLTLTSATITAAAIGAASGTGSANGTNTGDQTISITGDGTASGSTGALNLTVGKLQGNPVTSGAPGSGNMLVWSGTTWDHVAMSGDVSLVAGGAATVTALRGTSVSTTLPTIGQDFVYGPNSWQPVTSMWNVLSLGADPTNVADSTLAFYNAYTLCTINTAPGTYGFTTGTPTTVYTGGVSVSIAGASTVFGGTGAGKVMCHTTMGRVELSYTSASGSGIAGANVTEGIAGGTILAGSIIGVESQTSVGGIVLVPAGLYKITSTIWHNTAGVWLLGVGAAANTDTNPSGSGYQQTGGSWLVWAGALGGTVFCATPVAAANTSGPILTSAVAQGIKAMRISNMNVDCRGPGSQNGLAGTGMQFISCDSSFVENTFVIDPGFVAYDFSVIVNGALGEAHDCTRGTFFNMRYRCEDGATFSGLVPATLTTTSTANINTLTGAGTIAVAGTTTNWPTTGNIPFYVQAIDQTTGVAMDYYGIATGLSGGNLTGVTMKNTYPLCPGATSGAPSPIPSALMFSGATVKYGHGFNAIGVRFHGSATANTCLNEVHNTIGQYASGCGWYFGNSDTNNVYGAKLFRIGSGAGIGMDFQGATALLGASGASRNNTVYLSSPGTGGINLRGTDSYGYTNTAALNHVIWQQRGNGEPAVTIGAGVTNVLPSYNGGLVQGGQLGWATAVSGTITVGGAGTLVPGTTLTLPVQGISLNTWIRFWVAVSKTAAGTATWQALVKFGTANTTADAAIATFTSTANTAVAGATLLCIDVHVNSVATPTAATAQCMAVSSGASTALGNMFGPPGSTAAFNSSLVNPGPAFMHVDIIAGTAAVMTAFGSVEVMRP